MGLASTRALWRSELSQTALTSVCVPRASPRCLLPCLMPLQDLGVTGSSKLRLLLWGLEHGRCCVRLFRKRVCFRRRQALLYAGRYVKGPLLQKQSSLQEPRARERRVGWDPSPWEHLCTYDAPRDGHLPGGRGSCLYRLSAFPLISLGVLVSSVMGNPF